MRVRLNSGSVEISQDEALKVYEQLWQVAFAQRGALSAAGKLKYALAHPLAPSYDVMLDEHESAAFDAARAEDTP
jgi:hypothetical protein